MPFGVTLQGFARKRLADIKAELDTGLREAFGDINTGPDSVLGQLTGIFSKAAADIDEAIEATYNSMYPDTASGVSLDNAVGLTGIERLDATPTRATLWLTGHDGVVVPAASQAQVSETGAIFETLDDTVISKSTALRAVLSFLTTTAGTYTVRVNQEPATVVYTVGDLKALLAAAINGLDQDVTATVVDNTIVLTADDGETAFNLLATSQFTIDNVVTAAAARSLDTGPVLGLAGTITSILTPVSGWASVTNPADGILGRAVETDVQLRRRRKESLHIAGAASIDALRAHLRAEIESVETVSVYENRGHDEDAFGRPGHSIEAVIQGGADGDIGAKLWELKPAGIETFGNTTVVVTDAQGDGQEVSFTRPVEIRILVVCRAQVDILQFPGIGADTIKQAIADFGNALAVGEDVSIRKFYGAVFAVPGVLDVDMTVQRYGEPGTLTDNVLIIGQTEVAAFDTDDIDVDPTTAAL